MGCYGISVVTALTAQKPESVRCVHPIPLSVVREQLLVCLELRPDVIKTGMLYSSETVAMVRELLEDFHGEIVTDPVMIAGSGATLSEPDFILEFRKFIKSDVTVLTPNLPEALALIDDANFPDTAALASHLTDTFDTTVYLKGGHADDEMDRGTDYLATRDGCSVLELPVLKPIESHGTGCAMASGIAAGIATGMDVEAAAIAAKRFVWSSLKNSTMITDVFAARSSIRDFDMNANMDVLVRRL